MLCELRAPAFSFVRESDIVAHFTHEMCTRAALVPTLRTTNPTTGQIGTVVYTRIAGNLAREWPRQENVYPFACIRFHATCCL